jgi:hypothetical protein
MLSCFLSKSPKKGVIGFRDSLEEGNTWTSGENRRRHPLDFRREQMKAITGLPERTDEGNHWTSRENR